MEQMQSIWCFLHKDGAMDSPPGSQAQSCLLLGGYHEAQGIHMHPQSDEHTKESTGYSSLKVPSAPDAITTVGVTQGEVSSLPNSDLNFVLKGQM